MIKTRHTEYPDTEEVARSITHREDPTAVEGDVAVVSHPDSGTMGQVIARVENVERIDSVRDDQDTELLVTLRKVLTDVEIQTYPDRFPPTLSWPQQGAQYRVFALEHLNGRGEWVRTTPWLDNPYFAQDYYGEYQGHEDTQIKYKEATYKGPNGVAAEAVEISEGTCRPRRTFHDQ